MTSIPFDHTVHTLDFADFGIVIKVNPDADANDEHLIHVGIHNLDRATAIEVLLSAAESLRDDPMLDLLIVERGRE